MDWSLLIQFILEAVICYGGSEYKKKEIDVGGRGLHDTGFTFYGHGEGELVLRKLESNPMIVTPKMWEAREGKLASLHPHVRGMVDMSMVLLKDDFY